MFPRGRNRWSPLGWVAICSSGMCTSPARKSDVRA
jgi:hypothetical protein